jgi:P-type conjugative transfer ATPase TrbB
VDGGFSKGEEVRTRNLAYLRHALGEIATVYLTQPDVTDILLNPPFASETEGRLYVVRLGSGPEQVGTMSADAAERLIVAVAQTMNKRATAEDAVVEGTLLLDGSRFTGIMRPVTGAPSFAIRRRASRVFTLAEYVASGAMTGRQRARVEQGVLRRENTLIVGGTGAGKTTFGNAVLLSMSELTPDHRVVVVEDTGELQNRLPNAVTMQADEHHSLQKLIKTALRLYPHRVIVGEVRGPDALDMLMAWNTGHPGGFCTLHSNVVTPSAALTRLETLVSMATQADMQRVIGEAIDLIVCMERTPDHRLRVSQIVSVQGFDPKGGEYLFQVEGD